MAPPAGRGRPAMTKSAAVDTAPTTSTTTSATATKLPPRVVDVVPAMFVPLDSDITAPFEAPRDPVERAQAMLQSIDFHRTGVCGGMMYLAEMDRTRILTHTAMAAETGKVEANEGAGADETDALLKNMRAPAAPGVDYNVTNLELSRHMPQFASVLDYRDRKDTVRQLQEVVEKVLNKMRGYEGHIFGIQSQWTVALGKEQRAMEARLGGLPTTNETAASTGHTTTRSSTPRLRSSSSEDVRMTGT